MRVLITGGGGFLAGHLSAYLQTIADLEVRSLRRADCDLATDQERLSAVLRGFKPAVVFHLAGRISGSESDLDRDNRLATANLLTALRNDCPAARVVFGSTAAVYAEGGTAATPTMESDRTNPRGSYGTSKYACEQEARSYAEHGGWIVIARMSNPVGSNMDVSLLCGTLAKQVVEIERGKVPVVTLRDLSPKRDFISARDCARALWHLSQFGKSGETYNVASARSTSIGEVVEIYKSLARVGPIEVRTVPVKGERSPVQEQWLSNAKLLALGWTPQMTLRQAISDQLDAERARA